MLLFCEYAIPANYREAYLSWARGQESLWQGFELLENESQPGVFVEIRRPVTSEEAADMEKERRDGRSWKEMEQWVKGGREGVRIWLFRPVEINGQASASIRTEDYN